MKTFQKELNLRTSSFIYMATINPKKEKQDMIQNIVLLALTFVN